ncbi:hypothetical protein BS47DRAFT_1150401 [Hydnum rufescens UP504]|uniref:Uncharacterized protein n=1 Tax=Hydnum rufescens UP504 TaxID=1448309 RepID=A0A9P6E216_9AGAM|nr:hypothetical protein BS47DRAFT_1150401 [Hydnum rufescens UP504]
MLSERIRKRPGATSETSATPERLCRRPLPFRSRSQVSPAIFYLFACWHHRQSDIFYFTLFLFFMCSLTSYKRRARATKVSNFSVFFPLLPLFTRLTNLSNSSSPA